MTNLLYEMAKNWAILSEVTTEVHVNTSFIDTLVANAASDAPNVFDEFDLDNEDLEDF